MMFAQAAWTGRADQHDRENTPGNRPQHGQRDVSYKTFGRESRLALIGGRKMGKGQVPWPFAASGERARLCRSRRPPR
jgi:hypothetical protein